MIYDIATLSVLTELARKSVKGGQNNPWYLRYASPAYDLVMDEINGISETLRMGCPPDVAAACVDLLATWAESPRPEAKAAYGRALLMEGRPWFNPKKGMAFLRASAEDGMKTTPKIPVGMYEYGCALIDRSPEDHTGDADRKIGKRWIVRAARLGHFPAKVSCLCLVGTPKG